MKIDQWSAGSTPEAWRPDIMVSNPRDGKLNKRNKHFYNEITDYSDKLREQKAKIILSREHAIRKVDNNIYLVQSQTGIGWYKIQWNGKEWACNCPDFVKNGYITPCKHILALKLYVEGRYITIEGQEPQIEKKTYSQNWKKNT